jgi:hypothetical protein
LTAPSKLSSSTAGEIGEILGLGLRRRLRVGRHQIDQHVSDRHLSSAEWK